MTNLGNVVAFRKSITPPSDKPYLVWGKILNITEPDIVEHRVYIKPISGDPNPALESNWHLLKASSNSIIRIIPANTDEYEVLNSEWGGGIPTCTLIDTSTGLVMQLNPTYIGISSPTYEPTKISYEFGSGGYPHVLILKIN